MAFQNTQDKEKNLREKITKNQSPTKDWKSEGLSFSPSTLEARRQGAQPSLFWGAEISNREFYTQGDYKLYVNVRVSDIK